MAILMLFPTASALGPGNLFRDYEAGKADFTAGIINTKLGWNETVNGESLEYSEPVDNPPSIFNLTNLQPGDEGATLLEVDTDSNPHWLRMKVKQTGSYGEAFYQLDLASGEVIQNLSKNNLYGSRLQKAIHDNIFHTDRTVYANSNCLDDIEMELINSERKARANFTVELHCSGEKFTLASYNKISGGGWKSDEADEQVLEDYETNELAAGRHSMEIELPSSPHPDNGVALEESLNFRIWRDEGDLEYENNSEELIAEGSAEVINDQLKNKTLLDSDPVKGIQSFAPGSTYIGIAWWIEDTCEIAGETKTFEIGFETSQERKNPEKLHRYFSDTERSIGNTFSVSRDLSCGLCENFEILSYDDGENVRMQKFSENGGSEQLIYSTEIRKGSIKFEHDGGDTLGEDSQVETQTFSITTLDAEDISFRIKAGPENPVEHGLETGEPVSVMDGAFVVELIDIQENQDGSQTYIIDVTSDEQGGNDGSYALSFIEFNFCGDMPDFRGEGEKKGGKPGRGVRNGG